MGAPNPVGTVNSSYTPVNPALSHHLLLASAWQVRSGRAHPVLGAACLLHGVAGRHRLDGALGGWRQAHSPEPAQHDRPRPSRRFVLDWAPLRGASAYELQISPDQFFNAPIGGTRVVNSTSLLAEPDPARRVLLLAGPWSQHLKAAEPGPWSDPWVFTRAWPASNETPAREAPPTTARPGEAAPPRGRTLRIAEHPRPSRSSRGSPSEARLDYELQVGSDVNFSPNTYSTCVTNHTVVSPYKVNPPAEGRVPNCTLPSVSPDAGALLERAGS